MNFNELYQASADVLDAKRTLEQERDRYHASRRAMTAARAGFKSAQTQLERMQARVKLVLDGEPLALRLVDARVS